MTEPTINLYHGDCMEAMKSMRDKQYDLAIVDPPYGLGDFRVDKVVDSRSGKSYKSSKEKYKKIEWNNATPTGEYFLEVRRVARNHIVFGFQYYTRYLWPALRGVIIHDFKDNHFNMSHADCAITNLQNRTTVFRYLWNGFKKEFKEKTDFNRIHPCEKPLALYKYLLKNYTKPGDKILDTHGGSMSIAIACYDMGFDLDLWEIDEDYYKAGVKRFNDHKKQLKLFRA